MVNYVYTAKCGYNAIRRSRLLHQNVCIQFTPVMHVTARELHSYPKVCEVALKSKVYGKYPKSIIISPGSSTGAQKPRKFSIPARILPNFIQGDWPGKVLKPISISWTYRKGRSLYKFSTPLRMRTQNHRCTTLSRCGTGTGSAHMYTAIFRQMYL